MGTPRFAPEFKEEAVRQMTERGSKYLTDWAFLRIASLSGCGYQT